MKKQTRIGLLILVTLLLTFALTIPGLAKWPQPASDCSIRFLAFNHANDTNMTSIKLPGEFTFVGWQDGTLINVCEGVVPFGEPVEGQGTLTWFTYNELEDLPAWDWSDESATISSATIDNWSFLWDEDGNAYITTSWEYTVYPAGYFVYIERYTP